jgi:hypothetical protein
MIESVKTDDLVFDYKNPRLIEFGVTQNTPSEEILTILWDEMAVEEIVLSIAASGFSSYEPLIVIEENKKKIVVEGNRRLAAVNAILKPGFLQEFGSSQIPKIGKEIKEDIKKLPVIYAPNREAVWRFIGFKHVNGPAKWGSYAKAQYIAEVHNNYGVALDDIALQIGDTHRTVQRLYRALMVIDQAERIGKFSRDDMRTSRLYFSHLYTGLDYEGFRSFLGIEDETLESRNPVREGRYEELGELLRWIYGSKKYDQDNLIKSQNPHLRQLDAVLQNREALAALRRKETLEIAFEISQPDTGLFQQSLFDTKRSIQRAQTYVSTGYNGEEDLLKTAGTIVKGAETLYKTMNSKREELQSGEEEKYLTEDS